MKPLKKVVVQLKHTIYEAIEIDEYSDDLPKNISQAIALDRSIRESPYQNFSEMHCSIEPETEVVSVDYVEQD